MTTPEGLRQNYYAELARDLENFPSAPANAVEARYWLMSEEPDFRRFARLTERFGLNPTFGDMMTFSQDERRPSSTTEPNPKQERNEQQ